MEKRAVNRKPKNKIETKGKVNQSSREILNQQNTRMEDRKKRKLRSR